MHVNFFLGFFKAVFQFVHSFWRKSRQFQKWGPVWRNHWNMSLRFKLTEQVFGLARFMSASGLWFVFGSRLFFVFFIFLFFVTLVQLPRLRVDKSEKRGMSRQDAADKPRKVSTSDINMQQQASGSLFLEELVAVFVFWGKFSYLICFLAPGLGAQLNDGEIRIFFFCFIHVLWELKKQETLIPDSCDVTVSSLSFPRWQGRGGPQTGSRRFAQPIMRQKTVRSLWCAMAHIRAETQALWGFFNSKTTRDSLRLLPSVPDPRNGNRVQPLKENNH